MKIQLIILASSKISTLREQNKPNKIRQAEEIKIRAEINETENSKINKC